MEVIWIKREKVETRSGHQVHCGFLRLFYDSMHVIVRNIINIIIFPDLFRSVACSFRIFRGGQVKGVVVALQYEIAHAVYGIAVQIHDSFNIFFSGIPFENGMSC